MYSVFYAYRPDIKVLHLTLSKYKRNKTVILYDNGFLPKDIITPYQYFSNNSNNNAKPLFYNEVPIPELWQIEGNHKEALIFDGSKIKGKIKYTDFSNSRIVKAVEWFNDKEEIINIDYYNQYGIKFAEEIYDDDIKVLVRHFNDKGQEVIYQNYITNDIMLTYKGKNHHFDSYSKFINFFLIELNVDKENFLTADFSFVFSILNQLSREYHKIIVLQEKLETKNLTEINKLFTKSKEKKFSLLIPDHHDYNALVQEFSLYKEHIYRFGYYYPLIQNPTLKKEAMILTASDLIYNIDSIVSNCKDIMFNIAALSEMSDKLIELKKHKNVQLYPVIKNKDLNNLVKKSSIYLDINAGFEVSNVIENVFLNNLLIFGFRNTVHNSKRIADHFVFNVDKNVQLINKLKYYTSDENVYLQGLKIQKAHASSMDLTEVMQVLLNINSNEENHKELDD